MRITLNSVSKSYGPVRALDEVTVELGAGVTVLLGRNGAGKSTLSRIVAGVEHPDSGSLLRDGQAVEGTTALRRHLGDTGWMPQAVRASGTMTVSQYVRYAGWLKGLGGRELGEAVEASLCICNLSDMTKRRLNQLSGGMLRRAGVAQAVVGQPGFLVLDEPTVGLDPEQRGAFHDLIKQLSADRTILLSTHLLEDALATAQHMLVLDTGHLRFGGTLDELIAKGEGEDRNAQLRSAFLHVARGEDLP